jgi:hypothetical protein
MFIHAECDFHTQCDFDTHECNNNCDFNTHKRDLYAQCVILTRMSVILTRMSVSMKVTSVITTPISVMIHARVEFQHDACDFKMNQP